MLSIGGKGALTPYEDLLLAKALVGLYEIWPLAKVNV